ncbi:hypothetical protein MBLNU230_g0440t1 [Neophaeotheca triangularis]
MLLSGFTSPRRLALLAAFLFIGAFILMRNSEYNGYLPQVQVPGLSNAAGETKSSLEVDKETTLGGSGGDAGKGQNHHETVQTPGDKDASGSSGTAVGSSDGGSGVAVGNSDDSNGIAVGNNEGGKGFHQAPEDKEPEKFEDGEEGDWEWHQPNEAGRKGKHSTAATTTTTTTSSSSKANRPTSSPKHSSSDSQYKGSVPIVQETYEQAYNKVQELIKSWTPPDIRGHWPPYESYADKDYEPNRWEGFDFENDYYIGNGIRKLGAKPEPYSPYPDYNSASWRKHWKGEHVSCRGPRRKLLNESDEDMVLAYPSLPVGFPNVSVGSAEEMGIDVEHCFDRYHRYGPYGYAQGEDATAEEWDAPVEKPDWEKVQWGSLQDQCMLANKNRFAPTARQPVILAPGKERPRDEVKPKAFQEEQHPLKDQPSYRQRTAILIRTWEGFKYTENDKQALRALITEASLLSGGEYQVFLFVNVKDNNARIFDDQQVYDDTIKLQVPAEFHDIAILWNERIFEEWYPEVGDWQVYWHQFMPLQWFSKTHPEFAFVWNWEVDARYTGNHYHFFEQVAQFARAQPRKYQWERSSRFYFPDYHGSYASWVNDTDTKIATAAAEGTLTPVWGPHPYEAEAQRPIGPTPPHSIDTDAFTWGVDEEADLITLQPIWDPIQTEWSYREKIWNFIPDVRPHFTPEDGGDSSFTHPDFPSIPRRVYINTLSRFSRRQLHAQHLENLAGRAMQAEMWPATVALHHGLKAVYAPHPIWADRRWPAWYQEAIFNSDANKTARWGQEFDSPYNHDREHNFAGWSWYYATEFPIVLFRRWLGWGVKDEGNGKGGSGPLGQVRDWREWEERGVDVAGLEGVEGVSGREGERVGGEGRMCLPGMLLHPVKQVEE